jgi:hypothetical protein
MPVMSLTVGFVSIFAERLWDALPESPYFNTGIALLTTAGLILMGGLLAFLMVWTEFTVIANTSALTFMVAGTFKEIVTGMTFIPSWPFISAFSAHAQHVWERSSPFSVGSTSQVDRVDLTKT